MELDNVFHEYDVLRRRRRLTNHERLKNAPTHFRALLIHTAARWLAPARMRLTTSLYENEREKWEIKNDSSTIGRRVDGIYSWNITHENSEEMTVNLIATSVQRVNVFSTYYVRNADKKITWHKCQYVNTCTPLRTRRISFTRESYRVPYSIRIVPSFRVPLNTWRKGTTRNYFNRNGQVYLLCATSHIVIRMCGSAFTGMWSKGIKSTPPTRTPYRICTSFPIENLITNKINPINVHNAGTMISNSIPSPRSCGIMRTTSYIFTVPLFHINIYGILRIENKYKITVRTRSCIATVYPPVLSNRYTQRSGS